MGHSVYLVEYIGFDLDHHALFVEAGKDGSAQLFHAMGDIQSGMKYQTRSSPQPELSHVFKNKTFLGWVDDEDYSRLKVICASIPPPRKQYHVSKRLYPGEPLRRCQEWIREVLQALSDMRVLQGAPDTLALPCTET
ncbi:hypothetical protein VDGL01_06382 [Verticillium dahliae]